MTENFYVLVMRCLGDTAHYVLGLFFFFYGKGGNEINVSWIIQLVLDKMPQDEQN